jgi:hypothetical protein
MSSRGVPRTALQVERVVFAGIVALATFLGEEFASDGRASFWFGRYVAGVPLVYPAVVAVLAIAFVFLRRPHAFPMIPRLRSLGLWGWIVGAWITLAAALAMAIVTGAPELFADWRNFVLIIMVILVVAPWLSQRPWRREAFGDLVVAYGVVALFILARWLLGGGTFVFDQRITVFYWPHLLLMTYAAIVGTTIFISALHREARIAWSPRHVAILTSATVSTIVILLSFRRSFWLAWGAGMLAVMIIAWRRRTLTSRNVMTIGVTVSIGFIALFVAMGTDVVLERFASFLPSSTSDYSATNEDHVNDLAEALRAIGREPILGHGIGRTYETPSLADWKETSFEVHNAFLHAWLKFGIAGLVVFTGFHLQWIRAMLTSSRDSDYDAARAGVAAYIVAQLANTVAQTWVYGRVQVAVLMGVLLAILIADLPARPPIRPAADMAPYRAPVRAVR